MTNPTMFDKCVKVGITLPKEMIKKLDQIRGDISRSRYIYRALESYMKKGTIPA